MGVLVFDTWGDDVRDQLGVGAAFQDLSRRAAAIPEPSGPDEILIDVYFYFSGRIWQHGKTGFKLGSISKTSRQWQRVMIFVPDELTTKEESVDYFDRTLDEVADAVEAKLRRTKPDWPISTLVAEIRQLKSSATAA